MISLFWFIINNIDFDKITRMDSGKFVYVICSNLPSIFIDGKFEQNFYVKWGGDSWVHTIRNVCLYQSEL